MSALTADDIAQARKLAAASRRRLVDVLEDALAGDADAFTARLAQTLRLEYLTRAQLREATPAFDLRPFGECSQRGCALLRAGDGRLLLAFDDPFSSELHAWAEERIAEPFSWCLVHRGDLVAFLATHGETCPAHDVAEPQPATGPPATAPHEDHTHKPNGA